MSSAVTPGAPRQLSGQSSAGARLAGVDELLEGAKMSRLAMGCYRDFAGVAQDEGLFCVAEGLTKYTRWCIADETQNGKVVRRHVMVRGVELRSGQDNSIDRLGLWSKLAQCWPAPFEKDRLPADASLVVHRGIAEVAEGVWQEVQAFVQLRPQGAQISFGGHSLGGAVGLLLMCYCRTRLRLPPEAIAPAWTFGAPACLAQEQMRGPVVRNALPPPASPSPSTSSSATASPPVSTSAAAVDPQGLGDTFPGFAARSSSDADALAVLDLTPEHVRHFVQGLDVIPRCFLSVDPVWSALLKFPMVKEVLEWREQFMGTTVLSNSRFLYEMQGIVYLMEYVFIYCVVLDSDACVDIIVACVFNELI